MFFIRSERGYDDPYNRTVGPNKVKTVVRHSGLRSLAVCRCSPDQVITLKRPNGLRTIANIFFGKSPDNSAGPAILLQHGNTSLGKDLATYRALARNLADAGYTVLAYDRLGFGRSDDPIRKSAAETIQAYDPIPLALAAVAYAASLNEVDADRISVIGHSAGMMTALKLAMAGNKVRSVVLIGPPRRVNEEPQELTEAELQANEKYWQERFNQTREAVYGTPAPTWFDTSMTELSGPWAMEDYMELFGGSHRSPIMLVDGARESSADKVYLEEFFTIIAEPKKFVRLLNADHYHNTAQILGLIVCDRKIMKQLVDAITLFLGTTEAN